jgi:hypothetical protein
MQRGQRDPADKLAVEVTGEPLTFAYVTERLEKQLG